MTIFVGALSLDINRIQQNRADLFCCFMKQEEVKPVREEYVRDKWQKYFVPNLFTWPMKAAVGATTLFLITIGVMSQYKLVLGLNQNVSLV